METKAQFKFFRQSNLTYLDSAATTQTPSAVIRAVMQGLEQKGNPSRGSHPLAVRNEKLLDEARENIAQFIGAHKNEIVFANNTTDAFNLAIDAIAEQIKAGDEILVSIAEHHSHLLPYTKLVSRGAILKFIGIKNVLIEPEDIRKLLSPKTRIVAVGHCSNVLGNINDVARIGSLIKSFDPKIYFFVDGAQAVAHIPVNVKSIQADVYAFSSHKMYGPDGVGVLYCNEAVHHHLRPVRIGGGTVTDVALTFGEYDVVSPEYYRSLITLEGGTPNISNILGLSAAVNFIQSIGFAAIRTHERTLLRQLLGGLGQIKDVTVVGPTNLAHKIGVVSFGLNSGVTKELADHLSRSGICIRFGSHCALPLTEAIGQETVRISLGVYSDEKDIERILSEIRFFLEKRDGAITNPNLENLRTVPYHRRTTIVNSHSSILSEIERDLDDTETTEVVVMGGHFLGIPDADRNCIWPSIRQMVPQYLKDKLEEFGMSSFPLVTWELACKTVAKLKQDGYTAKLSIIANDTTGINELRLSSANSAGKSANEYRDDLFSVFRADGALPHQYVEILKKHGLSKEDILTSGPSYFFRETSLRANFKDFVNNSKNKEFFDGVIDYSAKSPDAPIELSVKVLDNPDIKICTFDSFNSKTGGKFCTAEVCEYIAELFGKADAVAFGYTPNKFKEPKAQSKNQILVAFTPAMCNAAVNAGAELYTKLFLQGKNEGSFIFYNLPLGPNAQQHLASGAELHRTADKVRKQKTISATDSKPN